MLIRSMALSGHRRSVVPRGSRLWRNARSPDSGRGSRDSTKRARLSSSRPLALRSFSRGREAPALTLFGDSRTGTQPKSPSLAILGGRAGRVRSSSRISSPVHNRRMLDGSHATVAPRPGDRPEFADRGCRLVALGFGRRALAARRQGGLPLLPDGPLDKRWYRRWNGAIAFVQLSLWRARAGWRTAHLRRRRRICGTLEHGRHLSGTLPLAPVGPTYLPPTSKLYFPFGDRELFLGVTDDEGEEIWITDGTSDGTLRLSTLRPGTTPSGVAGLVVLTSPTSEASARVLVARRSGMSSGEPMERSTELAWQST